jgi:hypothetical protein
MHLKYYPAWKHRERAAAIVSPLTGVVVAFWMAALPARLLTNTLRGNQ